MGRPRGCSSPSPASRTGAPICVRAAGTPFQCRPAVEGGAGHRVTRSVTRPEGLPVGHPEQSSSLPGWTRPDPTAPGSRASAYAPGTPPLRGLRPPLFPGGGQQRSWATTGWQSRPSSGQAASLRFQTWPSAPQHCACCRSEHHLSRSLPDFVSSLNPLHTDSLCFTTPPPNNAQKYHRSHVTVLRSARYRMPPASPHLQKARAAPPGPCVPAPHPPVAPRTQLVSDTLQAPGRADAQSLARLGHAGTAWARARLFPSGLAPG